MKPIPIWSYLLLAVAAVGLVGCPSDNPGKRSYSVTVTNLTAGQPLSPLTLVLHNEQWRSFETGASASLGVEHIAESGNNEVLLDDVKSNRDVLASDSGAGVVLPGDQDSLTLTVNGRPFEDVHLTWLSMLGNTNDAFAAVNGLDLSNLSVGDSLTVTALSYDAGTEANLESADTVPGPAADGGLQEGFNASRDDVRDAVYIHAGVVTQDDGLADSALTERQRWQHGVATLTVERLD